MKVRLSNDHLRIRLSSEDLRSLGKRAEASCSIKTTESNIFQVQLATDPSCETGIITTGSSQGISVFISHKELEKLRLGEISQILRPSTSEACRVTIEIDIHS
jgi:hypothetical protein